MALPRRWLRSSPVTQCPRKVDSRQRTDRGKPAARHHASVLTRSQGARSDAAHVHESAEQLPVLQLQLLAESPLGPDPVERDQQRHPRWAARWPAAEPDGDAQYVRALEAADDLDCLDQQAALAESRSAFCERWSRCLPTTSNRVADGRDRPTCAGSRRSRSCSAGHCVPGSHLGLGCDRADRVHARTARWCGSAANAEPPARAARSSTFPMHPIQHDVPVAVSTNACRRTGISRSQARGKTPPRIRHCGESSLPPLAPDAAAR